MDNAGDPIWQIRDARSAVAVAEGLINKAWPETTSEYSVGIWAAAASGPLAAILYTVAATRRADGIAAARQIMADLACVYPAPDGREWIAVADRCPNQFLAQCLRSAAAMNTRQRDSISLVMTSVLGAPPPQAAPLAV